jgi:hypothetical protein
MNRTAANSPSGKQANLCIAERGLKALPVEDYLTMHKAITKLLISGQDPSSLIPWRRTLSVTTRFNDSL